MDKIFVERLGFWRSGNLERRVLIAFHFFYFAFKFFNVFSCFVFVFYFFCFPYFAIKN